MKQQYLFEDKAEFLSKLQELKDKGISRKAVTILIPYPLHEVEDIWHPAPSPLRVFTLFGALAGLLTGFAFTIYTAKDWPLITGGKPIVSIPPFIIISFALTILFGALVSFAGFLILTKLPNIRAMMEPEEYGNQFAILINNEE